MNRIIIFCFLFLSFSCKKETNENTSNIDSGILEKLDTALLDKLLKCGEFDIREGYYRIPDNGCVYNPENGNLIGNVDVILIPITEEFKVVNINKQCDGDIDCLKNIYSRISSLSIENLKNNFNAIIFTIDKKYLKQTPQLDQPYNPSIPYQITSYILNNGYWKKEESYGVKQDEDLIQSNVWKDKYIDDIVQRFKDKEITKSEDKYKAISNKWTGVYTAYFSYEKIGGEKTGWELNISINKDSILAFGDGYQMGFKDLLLGEEYEDKILLYHKENIYGYKQGKKMTPEFTIHKNNNDFFVTSDWISDVSNNSTELGYRLEKVN